MSPWWSGWRSLHLPAVPQACGSRAWRTFAPFAGRPTHRSSASSSEIAAIRPVRITPTIDDAEGLVEAGADIVAFDATGRVRPTSVADVIGAIHERGALAMADCATLADGVAALAAGADIVGSTLSGYTGGPEPDHPDLELVAGLRELTPHVVAEGRIRYPEQAASALEAGAFAVVVGSAITRPEHITSWFAAAIAGAAGR